MITFSKLGDLTNDSREIYNGVRKNYVVPNEIFNLSLDFAATWSRVQLSVSSISFGPSCFAKNAD